MFVPCETSRSLWVRKNTVNVAYPSFKVRNYDICNATAFGNGKDNTIRCAMTVVWNNMPSIPEWSQLCKMATRIRLWPPCHSKAINNRIQMQLILKINKKPNHLDQSK